MSATAYLEGLVYFAATLACVTGAAALVTSRRCGHLRGSARLVGLALSTLGGLVAVHLLPGLLGVLNRTSVLAAAVLLLGAVWRFLSPGRSHPLEPPATGGDTRFSWLAASAALAAFGVWVGAAALDRSVTPSLQVDVITFHLPVVARWIQTGTLWGVNDFVADHAFGYYPNNGDLMSLAAVLPWRNDFLAGLVNFPLLGLTCAGAYAIARELRAPRSTALLLAVCLVAVPATSAVAVDGLADPFMLATFSAGVLFLLRQWRTGHLEDLLLAGLGLGLSAGTKWYALPAVAVVIGIWGAASLARRGSAPGLMRRGAMLVSLVTTGTAPWLVRNLLESGNPFFPADVGVFDAPVDRDRELYGNSISEYLFDLPAWRDYLLPDLFDYLTFGSVILWVGALAAVAVTLRACRLGVPLQDPAGRAVALAAGASLIGAIYLFLPYTAQGLPGVPNTSTAAARYVVPALVLAMAAGAWAAPRLGRLRPVYELGALIGVAHALAQTVSVTAKLAAVTSLLLLGGAVGAWCVRQVVSRATVRTVAAGGAAAAVVCGVLGYALERRFNEGRHRGVHPAVDYALDGVKTPKRIGLAGLGFGPVVYPMFGPRLRNEVEYVGPVIDGMLRPYLRRSRFARALARGRYDLVVVQLGELATRPGVSRRQDGWVRALGYRPVLSDDTLVLYERR